MEDLYRFARFVGSLGTGAKIASLRLLKHYCANRGWSGEDRDLLIAILKRLKNKFKGREKYLVRREGYSVAPQKMDASSHGSTTSS